MTNSPSPSHPLAAFAGLLAALSVLACFLPSAVWAEDEAEVEVPAEGKLDWTRGFYEFDERSWVSKEEMAFTNRVHYDSFYHNDPYKYEDSNDLFGFWKSINIEKDPELVEVDSSEAEPKAAEDEKDSPRKTPLFERMFENRKSDAEETEEPAKVSQKPSQTQKSASKSSDSEPLFHRLFKKDSVEEEGE